MTAPKHDGDELADARRSLRRARALLEQGVDPLWSVDADLQLVAFNRAFVDLVAAVRRPIVGLPLLAVVPADRRDAFRAAYASALAGSEQRLELNVGEGSGERSFDVRLLPMEGDPDDGRVLGWARETSERRRADALLARVRDAAEATSQAKSDFLAHISHEIRTPLNAIVGMTELTLDTELTDRQRRLLVTVRQNTEALLHLINDILDFSKIEAGQMELGAEPFVPADVVDQVVDFLAVSAARKGLRLVSDVATDAVFAALGDPDRFRQVVTNLLSNAIKYTVQGEVVVRLRATGAGPPGAYRELALSVIDTGVGIAPRDQGHVFSRFFRAPGAGGERTSGTGLGLSITRSLVGLMGGRIDLRSEVGRGSLFRVNLPLLVSAAQPEAARLGGLTVLVADPHPIARAWAVSAIRSAGAHAQGAATVDEAVRTLAGGRSPDVAIIDQDLDDPEGLGRHLKTRGAGGCRTVLVVDPTRSFVGGEGTFDMPLVRPANLSSLVAAARGDAMPHGRTATPVPQNRARGRTGPMPSLTRPASLLLVEDSVDNQQFALAVLSGAGHRVTLARDGREAVSRAQDLVFDLVLMDVHMPVMDGVEATAHIRSDEALRGRTRVPVVAFTAHATDAVRQRCLRAGMDDFLTKPVTPERLLAVVERWARRVPTILIADDDADTRALLREWLEGTGADLLFATHGEEAVRAARSNAVDVAVLDMNMPVLDGYQAARQLRAHPSTSAMPILALTGSTGEAASRRCLAAGCTAVLAKPVARAALLAALADALRVPPPTRSVRDVDPDIADLVPTYLANRRAELARAREELACGRFEHVERIGHSMKGSGTPYGYPELTELGGLLEECAGRADVGAAFAVLDRIEALLAETGG